MVSIISFEDCLRVNFKKLLASLAMQAFLLAYLSFVWNVMVLTYS
jgi:hypothetical protein